MFSKSFFWGSLIAFLLLWITIIIDYHQEHTLITLDKKYWECSTYLSNTGECVEYSRKTAIKIAKQYPASNSEIVRELLK